MSNPETPDAWRAAGATLPHDGLEIFFREGGAPDAPALVCIHGFPTSSWDFLDLWPALTRRYRVVASDLPGLGFSSKPAGRPLTLALHADTVEAVCRHLRVDEAHLLAHDLGDTVAQELLARQAEGSGKLRWRSCCFLNGGLFPETHRPRLVQRLLASPLGPLVARLSTERTFRRNLRDIFGQATPPSEAFLAGSWELLVRDGGRAALPALIRYMDERRVSRSRWVQPLVDRIVPMRLINGSLDPVSGRHAADRYLELVPDADIVRLDLGHYPHVEDPPAVLAAVMAFLDRVCGAERG